MHPSPSGDPARGPSQLDGPGEGVRIASWQTEPEPDVPRIARSALTERLRQWGLRADRLHPALLVLTELVTNAVEHARTRLQIWVTFDGTVLQLAVHDRSPVLPRLLDPPPTVPRGRGLRLVDALAVRWGCTPDDDGKTVWAHLRTDLPAAT